ncbi:MAG: Gldg family protein [Gemmiger sp.]
MKDKRTLHSGVYASLLTAAVLVVVILLNLVARALPSTATEYDISTSSMFTLSDTSLSLVGGLEQPVTVYYLAQTGSEDENVTRLLDRYAAASRQFSWQQRDPVLYPTFAQQYEGATNGCLVVVSGEKSKVIGYDSLYEMDLESYYTTGSMQYSFNAENAVTTAVAEVLRTADYTLYELTGHGETALESDFTETLSNSGVTVQSLNLLSAGSVPGDAAGVLLNAPLMDLSETEKTALSRYIEDGGRLLAVTDLTVESPNLDALLAEAGLTRQPGLLIETDANYYPYGYPATYLLPEVNANEVTSGVAGGIYVFAPMSQGIVSDEDNTQWTYTALLSTTAGAYSMEAYASAATAEKAETDAQGVFDLAVAAENETTGARLVWINCPNVFLSQINQSVSGGNARLLGSIVNWLNGEENATVIESRSMSAESLTVSTGAIMGLGLLFTIVLPIVCLVVGIAVCVIRRRR